ncbi:hypothetical protein ACVW1C_002621 [Bradyrhizobium sp. USDA 4011]
MLRKTLVDTSIVSRRGRIVKTTGDGMLFNCVRAVDAMRTFDRKRDAWQRPQARPPQYPSRSELASLSLGNGSNVGHEHNRLSSPRWLRYSYAPNSLPASRTLAEDLNDLRQSIPNMLQRENVSRFWSYLLGVSSGRSTATTERISSIRRQAPIATLSQVVDRLRRCPCLFKLFDLRIEGSKFCLQLLK